MAKKMTTQDAIVELAYRKDPLQMTEAFIVHMKGLTQSALQERRRVIGESLLNSTILNTQELDESVIVEDIDLSEAITAVIEQLNTEGIDVLPEAIEAVAEEYKFPKEKLHEWFEEALSHYCEDVQEETNEDFENITYKPYNESLVESLKESLENETDVLVEFSDRTATRASVDDCRAIVEVLKALSPENQTMMIETASKSVAGFHKMVGFSMRVLGEKAPEVVKNKKDDFFTGSKHRPSMDKASKGKK